MRRSRDVGVIVLVCLSVLMAGCAKDEPGTDPSPSKAENPSASASADPDVDVVSLRGDRNMRFSWTLDPGVDRQDPVVDVARRALVMFQLGYLSKSWTDRQTIDGAIRALTVPGLVSDEQVADWTDRHKSGAPGRFRVLISRPEQHAEKASVLACLDTRGVPSISADRATSGVMTRIDLVVDRGVWRVSSYNQNTAPTPKAFFERCKDFGA